MGIRFYCPNGHKLHVKAFQAGMRGICPYCGAKVQIPLQSTRVSTKLQRSQRRALAGNRAVPQAAKPEQSDDLHLERDPIPSSPTSHPFEFGLTNESSPANNSDAEPGVAFRSFPSPLTEEEVGVSLVSPQNVSVPPDTVATADSALSGSEGEAFSSEPGGTDDAALADMNTVWYVRPPSGGQFGPATGDIMRQWLQEGRITPDTLVWREGWRDWREARGVFSSFGGVEFPPPESISPAAASILARRSAGPSKRLSLRIWAILAITAIAAIAILVFFLVRGRGGSF